MLSLKQRGDHDGPLISKSLFTLFTYQHLILFTPQPLMSPAEIIIPALPQGSYKIFAAASARYYHAPFGSKSPQWEYSNYRGILVFGRNLGINSYPLAAGAAPDPDDSYWFRLLVSRSGETKTVWLFKVSEDLNYQTDKPYFHVIQGLVCALFRRSIELQYNKNSDTSIRLCL